jgi:5-methylthioadenosine/S-adenosylhomocysteine deaminase
VLLTGATVVTCDTAMRVLSADVRVVDGLISEVGALTAHPGESVVDLDGMLLCPGFVQTHIHLVQTLFRGLADDLLLLDWLRTRIWPLEGAHDAASTYASARLGCTELLLGGTTAVLDMASVRHTDSVFEACSEVGIRAAIGRAMMDRENEAGLSEPTERSLTGACDEADRWHGKGRLQYAFAPRFVPSCTDELLRVSAEEARKRGCLIHTHASENEDEVALVREMTGRDNVEHLDALGLSGPDVLLAHCIHLTQAEEQLLASAGTRVLHCPSSNLKLGSGLARIPELMAAGVHVSLGADGAPCNNRLDAFTEMRLAALLQKPRLGPTAMPAPVALALATRHGAEALGLNAGVIEPGRCADLVAMDPGLFATGDPMSTIVYSLSPSAVRHVWIGGDAVVRNGEVLAWSRAETLRLTRDELAATRRRAGL